MAEPNKKEDKPFETKVIESLDELIPSEPQPSKKEDKPFETEKIDYLDSLIETEQMNAKIEASEEESLENPQKDVNAWVSVAAAVPSAFFKMGEGITTLVTTLQDAKAGTNKTAEVVKFFDDINPFDEYAEARMAGKLTQTLLQFAVPGGVGWKAGGKIAKSVLKGRKNGTAKTLADLSTRATVGGTLEAATINDAGDLTFFGDRTEDLDGREEAFRNLHNRGILLGESIAFTGGVGALFRGVKKAKELANRKTLIDKDKPVQRILQQFIRAVRPGGPVARTKAKEFIKDPKKAAADDIFEAEKRAEGFRKAQLKQAENSINMLDTELNKLDKTSLVNLYKGQKTDKVKLDLMKTITQIITSGMRESLALVKKGKKPGDIIAMVQKGDKTVYPPALMNKLKKKFKDAGLNHSIAVDYIKTGRKQLDDLTVQILKQVVRGTDKKRILGKLQKVMEENIGSYVTRNFKVFDQERLLGQLSKLAPARQYENKAIREIINAAKKHGKVIDIKEARNILDDVYNTGKFTVLDSKGKKIDLDLITPDVVKKKSEFLDTMPALRSYLRENIDPRSLLAETVGKMAAFSTRYQLYDDYAEGGLKSGVIGSKDDVIKLMKKEGTYDRSRLRSATWDPKTGRLLDEGNQPIQASRLFGGKVPVQEKILKPDGITYKTVLVNKPAIPHRLNSDDLWIAPDFAKHIIQPAEESFMRGLEQNALYRFMMLGPKSISQQAKTSLGPVTHVRNMIGAGFMLHNSGAYIHLLQKGGWSTLKQAWRDAMRVAKIDMKFARKQSVSKADMDFYLPYIEHNIIGTSPRIGDLRALKKDVVFNDIKNGTWMDKVARSMLNKYDKSKVKKGVDWMEGAYLAEDDIAKVLSFNIEKFAYSKAFKDAGKTISNSELSLLAGHATRDLLPNYNYVGSGIRTLRKYPIGNFMSFPAEIIRVTGNTASRGNAEIQLAKELGVPGLRKIGLARWAGMSSNLAVIPIGIGAASKAYNNVTDEEESAARDTFPGWSKASTILWDRDKDGRLLFSDLSYTLPFDSIHRPFQTLMYQYAKGERNHDTFDKIILNSFTQAVSEISRPFTEEQLYAEALFDLVARKGRTKDGRPIWDEGDPVGEKSKKMVWHMMNPLMPGNFNQMMRIQRSIRGKEQNYEQLFDPVNEALGLAAIRIQKVNPELAMRFEVTKFNSNDTKAKNGFRADILNKGSISTNSIVSQYEGSNYVRFNLQKEMWRKLNGYKILNIKKDEYERQLDRISGGLNVDLEYGFYTPIEFDLRDEFSEKAKRLGLPNNFPDAYESLKEIYMRTRETKFNEKNPYIQVPLTSSKFDEETFETEKIDSLDELKPQSNIVPRPTPDVKITKAIQPEEKIQKVASIPDIKKQQQTKLRGQQVFGVTDPIFGVGAKGGEVKKYAEGTTDQGVVGNTLDFITRKYKDLQADSEEPPIVDEKGKTLRDISEEQRETREVKKADEEVTAEWNAKRLIESRKKIAKEGYDVDEEAKLHRAKVYDIEQSKGEQLIKGPEENDVVIVSQWPVDKNPHTYKRAVHQIFREKGFDVDSDTANKLMDDGLINEFYDNSISPQAFAKKMIHEISPIRQELRSAKKHQLFLAKFNKKIGNLLKKTLTLGIADDPVPFPDAKKIKPKGLAKKFETLYPTKDVDSTEYWKQSNIEKQRLRKEITKWTKWGIYKTGKIAQPLINFLGLPKATDFVITATSGGFPHFVGVGAKLKWDTPITFTVDTDWTGPGFGPSAKGEAFGKLLEWTRPIAKGALKLQHYGHSILNQDVPEEFSKNEPNIILKNINKLTKSIDKKIYEGMDRTERLGYKDRKRIKEENIKKHKDFEDQILNPQLERYDNIVNWLKEFPGYLYVGFEFAGPVLVPMFGPMSEPKDWNKTITMFENVKDNLTKTKTKHKGLDIKRSVNLNNAKK